MSEVFNAYSRQDWEDLALETLSGKSIDSLHEITDDEIEIKAIYSSEDQNSTNPAGVPGTTPFTRGIKRTGNENGTWDCLLYTSPSPRDATLSREPWCG